MKKKSKIIISFFIILFLLFIPAINLYFHKLEIDKEEKINKLKAKSYLLDKEFRLIKNISKNTDEKIIK